MAKKKTKQRKPSKPSKPEQTAIVVKPAPEPAWQLREEEITILKNAVAKGASDKELEYCLTVARRYRLDPFKQQIWFIPRWDSKADNGQNGKGANVWTPQVGINGLLFAAARDHRQDFGSISKPVYGPIADGHPEWARVTVTKKDGSSTEGEAYWDEYAPADLTKAPFWRKMPRRMLSKCATALAVREAYPDLGGLYIPEEMERMNEDFTKSGRQIEADVPVHGSHAASQAILAEKLSGERPLHSEPAAPEQPKTPAPPAPTAKPAIVGSIEIDYTDSEPLPIIRGDIAQLYDVLVQTCNMQWDAKVSFNRVPQGKVEKVRQMCEMGHYQLKEIFPKKVSPVPPQTGSRAMTDRRPATKAQVSTGATPEPVAVKGIIERVNHVTQNGQLMAYVTLQVDKRKYDYSSWSKTLNEWFEKGKGKEAVVLVVTKGKWRNIVGAKSIGSMTFAEDGKTPIIENSQREAGGRTLF